MFVRVPPPRPPVSVPTSLISGYQSFHLNITRKVRFEVFHLETVKKEIKFHQKLSTSVYIIPLSLSKALKQKVAANPLNDLIR